MSLYQVSVLKNDLKLQDSETISKAYKKYIKYFLNPSIQENIRNSKEEEYQGIFLTELFVNILGYTLKPNADFNLVAEYKNQTNARKADGAILNNDVAIGVIELKGTNTKDLESIRKQAFDYKANQKGCVYVITSNFEKLRFYINDATEFEEFNLFELSHERFALLYLCLQKDNIINNVPLKIKEASVVVEEQITKQFYKDYSLFKRELYRDLVKRNAKTLKNEASSRALNKDSQDLTEEELKEIQRLEKNVKLTLFQKSQKLIDRYLFIFFAEDRGLLPPNSTQQILDKWKADVDFGDDRPLYILFKQYFNFLDQGRAGTSKRAEIYAYNGGLFKEDKTLDGLEIDSDLLYKHTSKLAAYDFESQVDVNILGHIFENSLNEIESVNAEIEGGDFDKQKSKRKKDGVFYTPKYITKYIVENTIGKLCDEKKVELGFKEEEYFKGRKNRNKATITKLVNILDTYRDWLLQLTICDPACGSGAFLNQALDFLIKEHTYIDELKTKVLGGGLQFPDIENTILEKNIYGVDINEESVEIAKLSLWLRTAQPRRKLNDLSSNIKCGNSLIDAKSVAGDKAFKWEEEFPAVFAKGGFDVVIGNPPYVKLEVIKSISIQLENLGFETFDKRGDLYVLFVEMGFKLLRENGLISYIMPNKWLQAGYGKKLRQFFLSKKLNQLIDFGDIQIFQGATTYPIIFNAQNTNSEADIKVAVLASTTATDFQTNVEQSTELFNKNDFTENTWVISSKTNNQLLEKIKKKSETLNKLINGNANYGIKTGLTEAFLIGEDKYQKIINEDPKAKEIIHPVLRGRDIKKYISGETQVYLIGTFPALHIDIEEYPSIKQYLLEFGRERLEQSGKKGSRKKTSNKWFETQDSISYYEDFLKPKIMYQKFQVKPCFIYDEKGLFCNDSMWIIPTENKGLLGILNSKIGWWLITKYCTQIQNGCQLIWKYFGEIPIPELNNLELEKGVNNIMNITKIHNDSISKFQNYLLSQYPLEKLSKKLQNWYELDFSDFIIELNKAINKDNRIRRKNEQEETSKLTKKDEFEWMELFEENKKKAVELLTQINQLDHQINQMVYELYGLSEEEIKIVENS
jgi:hypothetical protein